MAAYDEYVWRLQGQAPHDGYDVVLPKDLEWTDEFSWNPVSQDIKNTLTGGLVIHEHKLQYGRPITLTAKDDMGWVKRPIIKTLHDMVQETGLVMTLDFVKASYNQDLDTWTIDVLNILESHNVMFAHSDTPLSVESAKRYDNFETDSWFIIRTLAFIEVSGSEIDPCA